jgi:hypothetical protein
MEELKHPLYYIHNKLRPNVVFNFVSVCKVSKINVKYVTCASAKRDDQNSVNCAFVSYASMFLHLQPRLTQFFAFFLQTRRLSRTSFPLQHFY